MVFVAHKYMPDQIPVEELRATFAARYHTLRYLAKSLRDQAHARTLTSYLITGPRGSGKTTLIRMLCLKLEKVAGLRRSWLPVRFPEELPTVTSLRDLLSKTLEILADADVPGASDWHQRVEEQTDEAQAQDIAIAGLQWIAREQNRRLILFVENLDLVFERGLTDTTQATLRRLLMTEPFMMIIGSAVQPFPELRSYDRAFFNYFCPVELEPLNEEQAYRILKRRAKWDGNTDFEEQHRKHRGKIRAISLLTGGNPRLLLMLYEILTRQDVQSAVQALRRLVDELTPLLKDILEHQLTKQQVKVVDALMQLDGNATPSQLAGKSKLSLNIVTSQLKRLEEARIVEVTGGGKGRPAWYSIRDRLFYTWYQMRYLQPGRRRIELFVQVLQIWFEADERMQRLHDLCATSEPCDKARVAAFAETAEYFAVSLAKTPHEELAWRMAIKTRLKAGQPELAVSLFSEFEIGTSAWGDAAKACARLSQWLWRHGDLQEVVELAHARMQEYSENAGVVLECGFALGLSGKHAEALSCFNRVLDSARASVTDKATALYGRGWAKGMQGDTTGEIADLTAVVEFQGVQPDLIAEALYARGLTKGIQGDVRGEIADYTAVLESPGIQPDLIAEALNNRGAVKGMQGDTAGAIADATRVIELEGAPTGQISMAWTNRGVAKVMQNDINGAVADFTAALELQGTSGEQLADALYNRGVAKGMQEDTGAAIEDYTGVLELQGIPPERIGEALHNRAVAKWKRGDSAGAIADCTTVIDLPGARPELIAGALFVRGLMRGATGDITGQITDHTAIVELHGAPSAQIAEAMYWRALERDSQGDIDGAITDFVAVVRIPEAAPDTRILAGTTAIREALAQGNGNAAGEIIAALRRWLTGLANGERTHRIVECFVALADLRAQDAWLRAFRELLKDQPEETLKGLEFLKPAAEVLETGDMSKLDALAPEQRDFALHVLGKLGQNKPQTA